MFFPFKTKKYISKKNPFGIYPEGAYERENQSFGNFQGLRYSLHR